MKNEAIKQTNKWNRSEQKMMWTDVCDVHGGGRKVSGDVVTFTSIVTIVFER